MERSKQGFPLWKWILELVPGIVIFLFVYILSQGALAIHSIAARSIVMILSATVLLLLFQAWTRLFEKKWRWELLTDHAGRHLGTGLLTGLVYFAIIAAILFLTGCYKAAYASPSWACIFANFCFYFLVACGEEVIFRGILFRLIDERFGFWWAIGASALLFGFAHISTLWDSIAIAIEAGLLLGAAYKYAGSLWLPIGIHWAWNFTQGNVLGFAVSGHDKEESIFDAVTSGPSILTGGEFGPEASIIAVLLGAALSAFFIWKICRKK